jgi:hypothetical protein
MQDNQLALIALVAALGVLGLVMVTVAFTIPLQQQAEARGCAPNPNAPGGGIIAVNASKGRCVH